MYGNIIRWGGWIYPGAHAGVLYGKLGGIALYRFSFVWWFADDEFRSLLIMMLERL